MSKLGPHPELLVDQGKLVLGDQMWRLGRDSKLREVAVVVERDCSTNKGVWLLLSWNRQHGWISQAMHKKSAV